VTTIFIFIDWFLPAYKAGGPVQSVAHLVDNFNDNIQYKILCSDADLDKSKLQGVKFDEWTTYNANTQVWYASKKKRSAFLIRSEIKNSGTDILYINGIYSWHFNLIPIFVSNRIRKIVSVRGMLHPGALTQKALKKKCFLLLWKLAGLHNRCQFHAADEQEKKYIQAIFGNRVKIHVAQNFPKRLSKQKSLPKYEGSLNMISIALISPMKNILLVLQALHGLHEKIIYNIYGPIKDKNYWQMCLEEIESMSLSVTVKYLGDIAPANVEQALSNSHLFILPSKSENFGHAIFEALSAGLPVITSDNTPWKLLREAKAGINVNPENSPSLSDAIGIFANMQQDEYDSWSNNAARYAANAINFEHIKDQYKKMFLS
jgi:glycosyltransferase involved in cell wall biosynthesis